jgi:tetratricopeptide (TPR) repeat protein
MLEARNSGQLLRSEADYQLHVLYLWYEHEPLRALELITGLRGRHPRNPHFPQVIAEINDAYLHDDTASLRAWQDMLDAAREKRLNVPSMAEARARLGIATQLERLFESDAALAQLQAVIQAAPTAPFGAVAQATLRRAQSLDRLGLRPDAVAGYRRAIDLAGERDPLKIAAQARSGLRTSPDAATTRAYRLSLEGWRAVERGALSDANRLLGESLALRPGDPVTQYRMARLRIAQGNTAAALAVLEQITELDPSRVPSTFYGYACFDAATILEQMNAPARAIDLYTRAIDVFGGDERTKASARRAVRRLSGAG